MAVIIDLPDDVVRQCLMRVPYMSHKNLKAVCPGWEAMLSDPSFYSDRKLSGNSDTLLCFLKRNTEYHVNGITVYDPVKGTSESVPINIPHCGRIPVSCKCVCVNRKLVLIGGLHPSNKREMKTIYIYDFVSARWSRGADIPNLRYLFAYAACSSTGRIYFAGGHDGHHNALATAEAYDVEEDKWEVLPPMSQPRNDCRGVCTEGKFVVLGGFRKDGALRRAERSAEVFDSREGRWTRLENMWSLGGRSSSFVPSFCSGQLHVLYKRWVMKYESASNVWTAVASLPLDFPYFSSVTQWYDWLFVSRMPNICYLVHLVTGRTVTFRSGEEFVYHVMTLEI